jgi:hypothetical protein
VHFSSALSHIIAREHGGKIIYVVLKFMLQSVARMHAASQDGMSQKIPWRRKTKEREGEAKNLAVGKNVGGSYEAVLLLLLHACAHGHVNVN